MAFLMERGLGQVQDAGSPPCGRNYLYLLQPLVFIQNLYNRALSSSFGTRVFLAIFLVNYKHEF